jgi:hypothetical protein
MSITLTPTQQRRVVRAREFLAATRTNEPAYDLGQARQHMRYLLEIIGQLTGESS